MEASMITSKKLIRMRRKWQKIASIGRKRNALTRTNKSSVVDKGCFAIYTIDKRRFAIPLAFLGNCIFRELLKMSEEEFGLPSDGPITLPCDSVLMNYIVSLVKRGLAKEMERAVLNSITTYRCSPDACFGQGHADQQTTSSIIASAKAEFQAKPPPAMEYLPLLTVHIPSFEFISHNLPTFFMTTDKQQDDLVHQVAESCDNNVHQDFVSFDSNDSFNLVDNISNSCNEAAASVFTVVILFPKISLIPKSINNQQVQSGCTPTNQQAGVCLHQESSTGFSQVSNFPDSALANVQELLAGNSNISDVSSGVLANVQECFADKSNVSVSAEDRNSGGQSSSEDRNPDGQSSSTSLEVGEDSCLWKEKNYFTKEYVINRIFQELFKMSEEEFGLSNDGPITLPGNSVIMSYIVLLVQRGLAKDLEKVVLSSIIGHGCLSYPSIFHEGHAEKQSLVCGF
ncbi:hypothetical protein V6N11_080702 [Hibiscus sabdariffa]|uniref:Uncharacterized protein n=1 Tax=Hibiscus sabdariffa TaxID=183260 RepID=A0ABR2QHR4_9ROSI